MTTFSPSQESENHASDHTQGGDDALNVESLPTSLTGGEVPTSDGAGGLVGETKGATEGTIAILYEGFQ